MILATGFIPDEVKSMSTLRLLDCSNNDNSGKGLRHDFGAASDLPRLLKFALLFPVDGGTNRLISYPVVAGQDYVRFLYCCRWFY